MARARPRAVSFDLDGTLVDKGFDDELWFGFVPREVARLRRIPLAEARRLVTEEYDLVGPDDARWYRLDHWLDRFGIPSSQEEVIASVAPLVRPFPDASPCLDALAAAGLRLAVVTLARREFLAAKLAPPELAGRFERVFSVPSDSGSVRKDSAAWAWVVGELGVAPGELVHVGDDPRFDLETPRSCGVEAFLIDRSGATAGAHVVHGLGELAQRVLARAGRG